GRGAATWRVLIRRRGAPVHEVMRPADEPNVIEAGAELVGRLGELQERLATRSDSKAGSESVFIGQIHSGEIFNQYPQVCWLEGTRRWLPGTRHADADSELRRLVDETAAATGTTMAAELVLMRDAFRLDQQHPFVSCFQNAYQAISHQPLPIGAKPFCDDGNSFWALANIPAITHGPRAGGAHTLDEWVSIDDLVRVAKVYALTAVRYCSEAVT